jgi:hypothetical protein
LGKARQDGSPRWIGESCKGQTQMVRQINTLYG